MHDLPLLVNIAVALAYALAGGLIARRLGLPTIVGYLVAGVALGPLTIGFRGDQDAIRQLAEFGVILLMFGVGIHFSFKDLWQVRRIAVPGALLQMVAVSALGYAAGRYWGFSVGGAAVLGIATSVASTVVLMRSLMDNGWLDTPHGKVAIGWLVFEDLLTVAILVLLPVVAMPSDERGGLATAAFAFGKAGLFIALMLFVGDRVVPFVLGRVANTRSRELFVLVALTVAAGTALASAALFNVSLALGAFVAGVVVSESPFSHQISADLLPFREAFAVIFFVSVGMLVDPDYIVSHWGLVVVVSLIATLGKAVVSGLLGVALSSPAKTVLVLAAGRSQMGEFSFIVGQAGVELGLISQAEYSLILAGAIVSITLNPFIVRLVEPAERALKRRPALWRWLDRHGLPHLPEPESMKDHIVVVGCGRVGRHIAEALGRLQVPRLVVESDPNRLTKLRDLGVPVLYGDASSSEILGHASLDKARALVITLPDDAAALSVVATAAKLAPEVPVVARASTWEGGQRLKSAGVDQVVRPELEGGLEIMRRTLLGLDIPRREVDRYTEILRREGMSEEERASEASVKVLDDLLVHARDLELDWLTVAEGSAIGGKTLAASQLRSAAGVSVVAIGHKGELSSNPGPGQVLNVGDKVAVIGSPSEIARAAALFAEGRPETRPENLPGRISTEL
jgi:CPA2 family monovalent cation:H+ antiporter-2